jgi:glycerate-2-kinase
MRNSFRSGREALRFAAGAGPKDDLIFLASGGGSALMAAPLAPFVTSAEKSALHRFLIVSGASIAAINTVRKHLSAVKGGRLAAAARRARTQTTLVLSDVDPESYEEVASGPSLPDPTTIDDMVAVIDRHGLPTIIPHKVLDGLRRGRLPETPASGDPIFRRSRAHLVLSNRDLRQAAERAGLASGLAVESMPRDLVGRVEEGAESIARAIEAAPPGTRLLVMGGEMVNQPLRTGQGGRAQELALRLALRMQRLSARPWSFLGIGSDGIDGQSPAAGAFVDATTLERAGGRKIDPEAALRSSNSYRFFKALGDEVVTGSTGTNLRDLYLLLTGDLALPDARFNDAGADRQPLLPE